MNNILAICGHRAYNSNPPFILGYSDEAVTLKQLGASDLDPQIQVPGES